jgi:beta-barrel assembly-enhancing protease
MKRTLVVLTILLFTVAVFGQQIKYSISGISNKRILVLEGSGTNTSIDLGKKVIIKSILNDPKYDMCYMLSSEGSDFKIAMSDLKRITFDKPSNMNELWQIVRINSDLDVSITSKGYQYDLRKDLEDETIDAVQNFEKYYGFFNDEFLEDYIQCLLSKIHSIALEDGRPGNFGIKILKTCTPNAFCMPTGTIILTTGLLSTIRSEDELIGILAHEVAHFVLDHQVTNINKAITRQKRADFWTGFTTSLAAASEVYLASKYDYVPTGILTVTTAILSNSIANSINERIGTNYNIEQELEADNAATLTLSFLGKDPKAFSSALIRIRNYCTLNRDFLALSGSGTHPALSRRIMKIGEVDPNVFNSQKYDQIISFVITYNSMNEYNLKHLETVLNLCNRNIESGVATEDDYLLKAMAVHLLYDTPEKNQEALDLINISKNLNVAPHNYIFKQEGLALIRLGKQKESIDAFKNYLKNLEIAQTDSNFDEIEWTKKMIFKMSIFQQ